MLELTSYLTLNEAAIKSPNLCDRFDETDLKRIGVDCKSGYDRDVQSRQHWMERNEKGMDLALQIQKEKTFPWPNCANVAFPLVTIAALQFHARAYPAIVNGKDIVKCAVLGDDPSGEKTARAERVSTNMSWQLLYQDKSWEDQEDKALLNVSIVGCNFKKSYFLAGAQHNVSELVLAKDLVLNYWAKSVEACPRKTHKIPLFRNEVRTRVLRGTFRDCLEEAWYTSMPPPRTTREKTNQDNRTGITPPMADETTSLMFCEMHVDLDLDGDGYAEPYIITFEENSASVVRIITRFDSEQDIERVAGGKRKGEIISIKSREYFTKKTFIPSPDGGIYDIGFGVFLGPLNETVNSLVNMLLDAGTMQTTGGGFLGRGAKVRGGVYTFAPFEWKRVDSTGDDLRKSIYQLPVNAPSDVLFQLLSLLINYTNRVAGTTDMMVGENPGQNTPAETSRTMVEMGQKIYTAIFKRIWRSSKEEFQKLFVLNSIYLPMDVEQVGGATREDYLGSPEVIAPVADPSITSDTLMVQQATMIKQSAMTTPGYDKDEVERRWLKAMKVDAIGTIFTGSKGLPPPVDPKVQVAQLKEQGAMARAQMDAQANEQQFIVELMEERRLNDAKILELTASAQEKAASAQTEAAYAQVAMVNAQISRIKVNSDHINKQIEHFLRMAELRVQKELETKKLAQPKATA